MKTFPNLPSSLLSLAAFAFLQGFGRAQSVIDIEYGSSGVELGSHIVDVGDFDADGYPDRLLSSPALGAALLYSGAPFAPQPPDPWGNPPNINLTGLIDVFSGGVGFGTAAIGRVDLDGDGKCEVAVSEPGSGGTLTFFRGGNADVLRTVNSPSTSESFGRSLCWAGDLDADGVPEIAIGSVGGLPGQSVSGRIYFYSFAKNAMIRVIVETFASGVPDTFGNVVVDVGDLDADGFPEIAATLDRTNSADVDVVRIYSGATGAIVRDLVSPVGAHEFGRSVVGGGPVGPNGHHVVVIGAPHENSASGAVYRFDAETGTLLDRLAADGCLFFGTSLAVTEGPDETGAFTLIVGAPGGWFMSTYKGRAFVFDGATSKLLATLESDEMTDSFGRCVAALGNTYGDSRSEFAVGAPDYSGNVGRAFVYSGVSPCGAVKDLGGACFGSLGITPRLEIDGCPRANTPSTLEFSVTGGPHFPTYGLLFLGAFDGFLKLSPICSLKFAQIFGSPILLPIVPNGAPFPLSLGSGHFFASTTIPAMGYAYGFRAQMVLADAGTTFGFSATNGVEVTFSP